MRVPILSDLICFLLDLHDFDKSGHCPCGEKQSVYLERVRHQRQVTQGPCLLTGPSNYYSEAARDEEKSLLTA